MYTDRLLIICSIIELSFTGCWQGPSGYTPFQWAALMLLLLKLAQYLQAPKTSEPVRPAAPRHPDETGASPLPPTGETKQATDDQAE